jgi:putative two-component system response regulator
MQTHVECGVEILGVHESDLMTMAREIALCLIGRSRKVF